MAIPEALKFSHLYAGVSIAAQLLLLAAWQWLHIKWRSIFFFCDGRMHKARHFNSYILHRKFSCHTWVNAINCHFFSSAKLESDLCFIFFLCEGCPGLFFSFSLYFREGPAMLLAHYCPSGWRFYCSESTWYYHWVAPRGGHLVYTTYHTPQTCHWVRTHTNYRSVTTPPASQVFVPVFQMPHDCWSPLQKCIEDSEKR